MINSTAEKVAVVGDIMLDIYHYGKVLRICPEAPVPVFNEQKDTSVKYILGGAANVAANLAAAGIETAVLSAVGKDRNGDILLEILEKNGIDDSNIFKLDNWITTTKLRYIGQNNQQILRVDREDAIELDDSFTDEFLCRVKEMLSFCSVIILSDYQKGLLTEKICSHIIGLAKEQGIFVMVDGKGRDYAKYRGADILKPNRMELAMLSGMPTATREQVVAAAEKLCRKAECKYVLTTLGADGMVLTDRQGVVYDVKSAAKEVYDVTGAGDTVIAYMATELARGAAIESAMETANYAAGVQVSKTGTSVVYPEELKQFYQSRYINCRNKILNAASPDGLAPLRQEKKDGKKIVFSNGCFDILHSGHVECLRKARTLGDCLVVAVNSDDSVKRLKGAGRPINPLEERLAVLSALEFVDYLVAFEEDTPVELIRTVAPDVLVKGGDYNIEAIAGYEEVRQNGGTVITIPLVEGKSTTNIIKKAGDIHEEK